MIWDLKFGTHRHLECTIESLAQPMLLARNVSLLGGDIKRNILLLSHAGNTKTFRECRGQ